ncbi:MAG TPA: SCO family protein, partial [Usitatibacteraceae bacterium]|nr:SCO family protein [Usitatibacteraceae bacterium]
MMRRRALARFLAPALFVLLGACESRPGFHGTDVTGIPGYGSDFKLTDHAGTRRSMADFRGKVVVLFFGYTQCPDVCPTTLSEMRKAMGLLGDDAARLQVLFVSVDPARDTRDVLAKYVPAFHPSFLGLSGERDAIDRVTRDFRIVAQIQEGATPESYTVNHSAMSLVFDTQGRLRLFWPYGMEAEKMVADTRTLLKGR